MIVRPGTGWRSGLSARLVAAAVAGVLTGAVVLLVAHFLPLTPVGLSCQPAGGVGCAIFGPVASILIGALLWLLIVVVVGVVAGGLCAWLSARFARVPLGAFTGVGWPVTLWVVATLLRPAGVIVRLTGAPLLGWLAVAFVLSAGLTAPQLRLTARLCATGLIVLVVVLVLSLR